MFSKLKVRSEKRYSIKVFYIKRYETPVCENTYFNAYFCVDRKQYEKDEDYLNKIEKDFKERIKNKIERNEKQKI